MLLVNVKKKWMDECYFLISFHDSRLCQLLHVKYTDPMIVKHWSECCSNTYLALCARQQWLQSEATWLFGREWVQIFVKVKEREGKQERQVNEPWLQTQWRTWNVTESSVQHHIHSDVAASAPSLGKTEAKSAGAHSSCSLFVLLPFLFV